jgi:hypothetical protein
MSDSSPLTELRLIAGDSVFIVRKALLLEKLRFFQEDTARLNAAEYRVRSPATREALADFVKFVECGRLAVGPANVGFLRALSAEFGCAGVSEACDCFEHSSSVGSVIYLDRSASASASASGSSSFLGRLCSLEERQRALERSIVHGSEERLSLWTSVRRLEAEVGRLSVQCELSEGRLSELSRLFEGEQLYRRGCEYLYGTNGYGDQGEFVSEGLGLSLVKASAELGHADAQFRYGRCLLFGRGCSMDHAAGREYVRRSADAGNSFGEYQYGNCLRDGCGGAKDAVCGAQYQR